MKQSALRNLFPKKPELRGLWKNKVTETDLRIIFPGMRHIKVLSAGQLQPKKKKKKDKGELLESCK